MHIIHTHTINHSWDSPWEVWGQYISVYFTIINSQVILLKEPSGPQWYPEVQVFYYLDINN